MESDNENDKIKEKCFEEPKLESFFPHIRPSRPESTSGASSSNIPFSHKKKGKSISIQELYQEEEKSRGSNPALKIFASRKKKERTQNISNNIEEEEIATTDNPVLKRFASRQHSSCSSPTQPVQPASFDQEAAHGISHHHTQGRRWVRIIRFAFQNIGVVYGDLGTSPLYVLSGIFPHGVNHTDDLVGALSLIFYSLVIVALIKYVFIVLAANDHGDGGTFAMYSLMCRYAKASLTPNNQPEDKQVSNYICEIESTTRVRRSSFLKNLLETNEWAKYTLLILTLTGTALSLGDGILTPAMSVLSATEGIKYANESIPESFVVWLAVVILVVLFQVQRFGTDKVAFVFAPIILVWFVSLMLIGVYNFFKYDPTVIKALNPVYIITYFLKRKESAWISLGGVILALTGAEALFHDLGHFDVISIRLSSCFLVFPSIIIFYFGQVSYLRLHHEDIKFAFYRSIPNPIFWPMWILSILAAIIASQALISASFTMVHHAMAFGCFPRVKVVHTSVKHEGQIYVPEVNHLLMLASAAVTIGFGNTVEMGHAYGIAVAMVFQVTSAFLIIVMVMIWKTNLIYVILYVLTIEVIELIYLSSVLYKFIDGGFLPILFSLLLVIMMYIWSYGDRKKYMYDYQHKVSATRLAELASDPRIRRLPGIALFYTDLIQGVSPIFTGYIRNIPAMHSVMVFVSVKSLPIGKVSHDDRFLFGRLEPLDLHIYRCIVRYGYKDVRLEMEVFEENLIYMLKEFIKEESMIMLESSTETDIVRDKEVELQKQLGLVDEAANEGPGIVYLIGDAVVVTSLESSWLKRFTINCCYNYLTRCVRQSDDVFVIPRQRMLKVAMSYDV